MKKIATLMALLLLAGCSKKLTSVDDAVALAREKANLTDDNSELIKSSFEDGEYYVELIDQEHVYRYVIDDDGKVESFVKEAKSDMAQNTPQPNEQTANNGTTSNDNTDNLATIDREQALSIALSNYDLSEDQVYEIEIDEDFLHTDRLTYNIDFKTDDLEYEVIVDGSGNIVRDHSERNDDRFVSFVGSVTRQEAIDAALSANGHDYADVDELTIKQSTHFDSSYYEVDYEIDHRDYEMLVDANTLEVRNDN